MTMLAWIAIVAYAIGGVIMGVMMARDIYATGMPESSMGAGKHRMKHVGNLRYATLMGVFFAFVWIIVVVGGSLAWVGSVLHNWVLDGDRSV